LWGGEEKRVREEKFILGLWENVKEKRSQKIYHPFRVSDSFGKLSIKMTTLRV
jgi:hypothetical protein